ncbi:MAG: hypothetical protein GY788_06520 [bacterium]|nr:hypothetical protein [bacterium]
MAHEKSSNMDCIGWGLLFIWLGVSLLLNLGWPAVMIGFAAVVLGMQAARYFNGLSIDTFWIVVGLVFAGAGFWEIRSGDSALPSIALIAGGVILLLNVLRPRKAAGQS